VTTKTREGTVTTFNRQTGRGKVELDSGKTLAFGATSFRSGRPARYAAKGDPVQVIVSATSDEAVVSVRLVRANQK